MITEASIHIPFVEELENSKTIVIFIHGILESPHQFKNLAKISIENNASVCGILLEGHGKTGEDFANSSLEKWESSVELEIKKYIDKYEYIILVGHSMGALLSIDFYLKYNNKIKAIVAIATPLNIRVRFNIMKSSLKIALGIIKEDDTLTNHANDAFSIRNSYVLTYIKWLPRYMDLFKLTRRVRSRINDIDLPMLIVHCMNDELVSNKSIKTYEKSFEYNNKENNKRLIKLINSGHFYYEEKDLNILEKEFMSFINSKIKLDK